MNEAIRRSRGVIALLPTPELNEAMNRWIRGEKAAGEEEVSGEFLGITEEGSREG